MSDLHKTLVDQAASRDSAAIDSLLIRHLPRLRAFVRMRSGKEIRAHESSSDIVQSVCREVLERIDDFEYRGESQFRCWLFTKALSKIHDRYRHYTARRRDVRREEARASGQGGIEHASYFAELVTPSRTAMGREEIERIESAFDQLSEDHREVITMHRVVGMSHKEIAERLGRSEEASRKLLKRALMALSWALREQPADG